MDLRAIGTGLAFAFMWSSAFASARIIVADAPPLGSLAVRFLVSGLIGIAIAGWLGQNWKLSREQWRATFIFGLCQNALYLGLNFVAMTTIQASLSAIIASTMPLMVALAGWVFFREKLSVVAVAGLIAGAVGVGVIMGARVNAGVDMFAVMLCLIGALALTIATLSVRSASSGGNLLMIVGLQMLVGSAVLTVASALLETIEINWTWQLCAAFAYTTVVPGLLATWVWFTLVARIGAIRAATFHFLNPFLGVAVAAVLLGENLGWLDMVGVLIISIGILAVQLSRKQT